jgi:hypothetical protein
MSELTMSERLKFLLSALNLKIGPFARTMGVSDTNVRNYLDRGSKPSSEFLETLILNFDTINPAWLLTGKGEPFLSPPTENPPLTANTKKISRSQVIGSVGGDVHQNTLDPLSAEQHAALQREIELLRSQLNDKERIIQLLLNQQPKS